MPLTRPFGDVEHLFDDELVPATVPVRALDLPVDVTEEKDKVIVEAAVPGIQTENIRVEADEDTVTIEAKREEIRERETNEFTSREIRRGTIVRTVALPADVDPERAGSWCENGVLHIELPKKA